MRVVAAESPNEEPLDPQTAAACLAAERLARQIVLTAHDEAEHLLSAARAQAATVETGLVGRASTALEGIETPRLPEEELAQLASVAGTRSAGILQRAAERAARLREAAEAEVASIEAESRARRRAIGRELRALEEERDDLVRALEARVASVLTAGRVAAAGAPRRRLRYALAGLVLVATAALAGYGGWAIASRDSAAPAPVITPSSQPIAPTGACPIPARFRSVFVGAAHGTGVPLSLLTAVAAVESRWKPDAHSAKGAVGLMQLLPSTAREVGVNPFRWRSNVRGGARYLRQMLTRFHGNTGLALAAYEAGPTRVAQGTVPLETLLYVGQVMARQSATVGCR